MSDKKKKILKVVGYLSLFAYIIGMLFLVVFLKRQAQDRLLDFAVANTFFDIYVFSLGACLLIIMPFSIKRNVTKVIILSYIIFAVFLGVAIYFKYYTLDGSIIADLFYIFSGAMFYQGTKLLVNKLKGNKKSEEEE